MLFVEHDMDIVERYAEPRDRVLQRPHHRRRRAAGGARHRRRAPLRHRRAARGVSDACCRSSRCTSRSSRSRRCAASRSTVADGRMVGLVGRNGAGKTTLMRTVMGHLPLRQRPHRLRRPRPRRAAARTRAPALGIGYMPEDRGLVPELTVEENILVPVWVNRALRRRRAAGAGLPRAARAARDARAPRAAALGRAAEAGRAGARAGRRHAPAAARRAVRGRRAGAVEAPRRRDRRPARAARSRC